MLKYPWEFNQFDLLRKWIREVDLLSEQLPRAFNEMANLIGIKAYLLPRKYEGDPCPNLNPNLKIHTHHDCKICYGTGIVGGYENAIEVNVIPQERQMIIQWRSIGYTPENTYHFLIPGTFVVKTEDVLVISLDAFRKYYDFRGIEKWDYEDVRFSIVRVTPTFLRKRISCYEVEARLLPENHVIYYKPLFTDKTEVEGVEEVYDNLPEKTRPAPTSYVGGIGGILEGDVYPQDDNWYDGYIRID